MKKFIIAVIMVLCSISVHAQIPYSTTIVRTFTPVTINLTSTGADTVDYLYFLFPDINNNWYFSETLPTSSTRRGHSVRFQGGLAFMVEPNSTSGQADSLRVDMRPLVWDEADQEYAVIEDDVTYLVMGQAGTYTATTRDYLDWTTGVEYQLYLHGLIWGYEGIQLEIHLGDEGMCDADITFQPHLTQ